MVKKNSEGTRRVRAVLAGTVASTASIPAAADTGRLALVASLTEESTLGELARVGGFLRTRPSELIGGIA